MEGRVRDGEEDSSILAVPEEVVLTDAGNVLLSLSTQRGSLILKKSHKPINRDFY